ncbi:hypothetical protein [Amphritea sp.]|uniref:hypothetical protein n=1 Tax=Amphritea sp. TaxID=1872502 RepID=UPI0025BAC22A|nr:hypothetical protein [Amphritea sp.]
MYYLRSLLFILCCLPLTLQADSDIRIHGGITLDTGNLRLYISDRQFSSHLYFDRNHFYNDRLSNRSDRYRSQRHYRNSDHRSYNNRSDRKHRYNQHKQYRKYYSHNRYEGSGHNRHFNSSRHSRQIIIRDSRHYDYRKFRHQRSYNHW